MRQHPTPTPDKPSPPHPSNQLTPNPTNDTPTPTHHHHPPAKRYMAPEALSSAVEPVSDVWSAGVMAYQLISGRFPFDDWSHPDAPALSLVWRSILTEQPKFGGGSWGGISEAAKDFCRAILNK